MAILTLRAKNSICMAIAKLHIFTNTRCACFYSQIYYGNKVGNNTIFLFGINFPQCFYICCCFFFIALSLVADAGTLVIVVVGGGVVLCCILAIKIVLA